MSTISNDILKSLKEKEQGYIVFFDTETNGLSSTDSIYSISAIKCKYDYTDTLELTYIDFFERFYHSVESPNERAIACNGMTAEHIDKMRDNCDYPLYYKDDNSFKLFCEQDVDLFVAHNASFDTKFFPWMKDTPVFCTMKSNTDEVKIPNKNGRKGFKWPSLEETANYYKIPFEKEEAHASSYDTLKCFQIFEKMVDKLNGKTL